tara:strand:- start:393 stop:638 length:246 start_codon:yes stop_codon:yes gene_type:complete
MEKTPHSDNPQFDLLIKQKKQKIELIRQLYKQLEEEKKNLHSIETQILNQCRNHNWVDDGTFDIQNNSHHWYCSICKRYKN